METHRLETTLDDVRLAIFRQHTQLAQLIDEVESAAAAVIAGGDDRTTQTTALERLTTRFSRHLDYEESHLRKWLPAVETSPDGLLGGHDDQRLAIAGLVHDSCVFADPRTLGREVMTFVHRVRKDMQVEDAALRALKG